MKISALKKNSDFLRIYRRGKSAAGAAVVCYVLPNRTGDVRLGLTSSKKIGGAVQRNRARRVMRAAFREVAPLVRPGVDIVLVARVKTVTVKSTALLPSLTAGLGKLGALQSIENR